MIVNEFRLPHLLFLVIVVGVAALLMGCSGESQSQAPVGGSGATAAGQSSALQEGEAPFNKTCAVCHGAAGAGTQAGPPLVNPIYQPGHHPDVAFRNAVKNGVVSHHWEFGHMPPQPGVSEEDVEKIICYVRELQVAGGIYEGEGC